MCTWPWGEGIPQENCYMVPKSCDAERAIASCCHKVLVTGWRDCLKQQKSIFLTTLETRGLRWRILRVSFYYGLPPSMACGWLLSPYVFTSSSQCYPCTQSPLSVKHFLSLMLEHSPPQWPLTSSELNSLFKDTISKQTSTIRQDFNTWILMGHNIAYNIVRDICMVRLCIHLYLSQPPGAHRLNTPITIVTCLKMHHCSFTTKEHDTL